MVISAKFNPLVLKELESHPANLGILENKYLFLFIYWQLCLIYSTHIVDREERNVCVTGSYLKHQNNLPWLESYA